MRRVKRGSGRVVATMAGQGSRRFADAVVDYSVVAVAES